MTHFDENIKIYNEYLTQCPRQKKNVLQLIICDYATFVYLPTILAKLP